MCWLGNPERYAGSVIFVAGSVEWGSSQHDFKPRGTWLGYHLEDQRERACLHTMIHPHVEIQKKTKLQPLWHEYLEIEEKQSLILRAMMISEYIICRIRPIE